MLHFSVHLSFLDPACLISIPVSFILSTSPASPGPLDSSPIATGTVLHPQLGGSIERPPLLLIRSRLSRIFSYIMFHTQMDAVLLLKLTEIAHQPAAQHV